MYKGPLLPLNKEQMLLKECGYRAAKAREVGWIFHNSQKAALLGRKMSETILAPLPGVQETDRQAGRQRDRALSSWESATARQPHS